MKTIAAIVVVAALAVPSFASGMLRFDQGFSIKELLRQLKSFPDVAVAAPSARTDKGRIVRWIADYKKITMLSGQTESEVFSLTAVPIEENCTFDPRAGTRCTEGFGMSDRRDVQLVFRNRPQVSDPELFEISLEWHQLSVLLQQVNQRYDWQVVRAGNLDQIVFTPAAGR
ncbi:MAG: hypothetical protein HY403_05925 [Elusimicrobia bacterium]|nr:hypothetical protein [Elusimicrobiota bacterium]